MRKVILFVGVIGLGVAPMVGTACSSNDPKNGVIDLPGRTNGKDATSEQGLGEGGPAASCTDLPTKVSDRPVCDKCAKEKCCAQIQTCNESEDCTALQSCLAPCAQSDIVCILTCQDAHATGAAKLQEVGSCATNKCKVECPSETPDADIFDAP